MPVIIQHDFFAVILINETISFEKNNISIGRQILYANNWSCASTGPFTSVLVDVKTLETQM